MEKDNISRGGAGGRASKADQQATPPQCPMTGLTSGSQNLMASASAAGSRGGIYSNVGQIWGPDITPPPC